VSLRYPATGSLVTALRFACFEFIDGAPRRWLGNLVDWVLIITRRHVGSAGSGVAVAQFRHLSRPRRFSVWIEQVFARISSFTHNDSGKERKLDELRRIRLRQNPHKRPACFRTRAFDGRVWLTRFSHSVSNRLFTVATLPARIAVRPCFARPHREVAIFSSVTNLHSCHSGGVLHRGKVTSSSTCGSPLTSSSWVLTILFATSIATTSIQTASAQDIKTSSEPIATTANHPALLECRKRFRLKEISAQVPHQPRTMAEFCLAVEVTCKANAKNSADCNRAINQVDRQLAHARGFMSGSPQSKE
jgi:hypothetical protein